jgi:hypothetical protein
LNSDVVSDNTTEEEEKMSRNNLPARHFRNMAMGRFQNDKGYVLIESTQEIELTFSFKWPGILSY